MDTYLPLDGIDHLVESNRRRVEYTSQHVTRFYWSSLIIAQLLTYCFAIFVLLTQILADQFYEQRPPLRDVLHTLVDPPFPSYGAINTAETLLTVGTLMCILFLKDRHMRFSLVNRIGFICAVSYGFRALVILVTSVPDPVTTCVPMKITSFADLVKSVVSLLTAQRMTCSDVIVSGHSILLVLNWLTWSFYFHGHFWLKRLVFFIVACIAVCCATSRLHYTVDVILAVFISIAVFVVYHICLEEGIRIFFRRWGFSEGHWKDKTSEFSGSLSPIFKVTVMKYICLTIFYAEALEDRMMIGVGESILRKQIQTGSHLAGNSSFYVDFLQETEENEASISCFAQEDPHCPSSSAEVITSDHLRASLFGDGQLNFSLFKYVIAVLVN